MKSLLLLLSGILISHSSFSQFPGCPSVDAGPDQTLNCSTPCATLTATPFNAGATTSYVVNSIPHNPPIPYNQPGTGVSVGTDDVWSPAINLPFNFCFYGVNYSQILVGSNGNLSFNVASAGGYCPWPFSATCPSTALNSAGNIFGIYHDIDPSVCGNIKWNLVGTAPCRIFVVSFDQICQFSCTSIKSRHMIVLYETTNVIDVYVESKPTCSGWNSGNALIGIQNPAGTAGVTPPGRNTAAWTVSTPEAWRFLPNGAPIYTVEWLDGTTVVGTTPTISVCPTTATTYTAKATYTRCDGTTVIEQDQVTVTPANTTLALNQATNNPASCGQANGSFSVTASGGTPGYTYSIDNVTYNSTTNFTGLTTGNYVAYVQDAAGCISTLNTSIADNSTLGLSINQVQNVSCYGNSTGSISALASGGTQPYTYSINGTTNGGSGNFSSLPAGNYTILVSDNIGCTFSIDTIITQPTTLNLTEVGSTNSTCNQANGGLEVTATGGVSPYNYSINNGTSNQSSAIFNNLSATTYTVLLTDGNGCTTTLPVTVGADPFPNVSIANTTNISCYGGNNGSLTVSGSSGLAPYSYSINGGTSQTSPSFGNLAAGSYTIDLVDANGCTTSVNATITQPTILTVSTNAPQTICEGTNVNLAASTSGGTAPYTYTWSSSQTTSSINVSPSSTSSYTVTVNDANGCSASASTNVNVLPIPTALASNQVTSGYAPLTVVFENLSSDASSYTWDYGNGQSITTPISTSQTGVYQTVGDFTVILTASNGICESTWTTIITVIPYDPLEIYVPNVFTPTGDDSNDYYYISTKNAKEIEGVIIDRWGITMVEFNDLNFKWDGKVKGKEATEGTYFLKYKVTGLDGTVKEGHTFFQLVK